MATDIQTQQTKSNAEAPDQRIAVRFGDRLLEAGHTAIPNLVLNAYAKVGISPAEMLFVVHVWQHWWNDRDPYPALGTIAERMGISRRQARNYVHSLKEKKFLEVHERILPGQGQTTSEYDFAPLLDAVRRLGDGDPEDPRKNPSGGSPGKDPSWAPGNSVSPEEDEEQEDPAKASKAARAREETPAAPQPRVAALPVSALERPPAGTAGLSELLRGREQPNPAPQAAPRPPKTSALSSRPTPYLDQMVGELTQAIGDDAHLGSNLARVRRLMLRHRLDESSMVAALLRSHSLLKARSREGNAPVRRAGAYLFAILEDLLIASASKETHRIGPGSAVENQAGIPVPRVPNRPG